MSVYIHFRFHCLQRDPGMYQSTKPLSGVRIVSRRRHWRKGRLDRHVLSAPQDETAAVPKPRNGGGLSYFSVSLLFSTEVL